MIFTVGHEESYERYFEEQENLPRKLGRTEDYVGGSVWKTVQEAQKYCPKDYKVYGVLADWENDTVPSKEGPWHDLLVTSPLVRVIANPPIMVPSK